MLEIKDMKVSYGMIQAIKGISFTVHEGEIVSLIGANGAGKSTILKTISGLIRPTQGELLYDSHSLQTMTSAQIVKLGISQVPEGRHVFSGMTVKENLLMGAYTRKDRDQIA